MKLTEWVFGKKKQKVKPSILTEKDAPLLWKSENETAHEPQYRMGWQIYMKSGEHMTRFFEKVPTMKRESVRENINAEVSVMEAALHMAIAEKKVFVNLSSNIMRVDDVVKICVFDSVEKK